MTTTPADACSLRTHILAYLSSVSEKDPEDESLEVALQCLRESFERSCPTPLASPEPTALLAIFNARWPFLEKAMVRSQAK